jgi:hypothetical protein
LPQSLNRTSLFNRQYEPIRQRIPGCAAEPANPNERIARWGNRWFYDEGTDSALSYLLSSFSRASLVNDAQAKLDKLDGFADTRPPDAVPQQSSFELFEQQPKDRPLRCKPADQSFTLLRTLPPDGVAA